MSGIAEGNVTIVAPITVDVVIGDAWQTGETEDDLAGNTRCTTKWSVTGKLTSFMASKPFIS